MESELFLGCATSNTKLNTFNKINNCLLFISAMFAFLLILLMKKVEFEKQSFQFAMKLGGLLNF